MMHPHAHNGREILASTARSHPAHAATGLPRLITISKSETQRGLVLRHPGGSSTKSPDVFGVREHAYGVIMQTQSCNRCGRGGDLVRPLCFAIPHVPT
eukprot:CAMPEP_0181182434 /NCGR_PEP_ID=MMETSP1096-20121128/7889_1 /TAXON_ID=156174 ORGANISM="Chrysochromulina ericina, Strain CCMP281" /NCGR_SAMPLE_ID=MMETSP1096 /ASSEMBLY_ACC=CAM_ASM_000453 /LENGTH=97 /DNA_ID=CAMNT_0023271045 /DNA_START=504 /DNA_END=796 /DNA_ORIENTATION=+